MSARTRLLEIMSAAGLAKLKDEQALREGAASAANTAQWSGALQSLVPALTSGLGAYQGSVADDAKAAADQVAAEHIGDTGTVGVGPGFTGAREGAYVETPSELAAKAIAGNATLNPQKPTGLADSLSAFLGDSAGAAAKAKAYASTKIATGVDANRTGDEAKRLAAQVRAQAEADKAAALAAAATQHVDDQKFTAGQNDLNRQNAAEIAAGHDVSKKRTGGAPAPGSTADLQHQKLKLEIAALEKQQKEGKPLAPEAVDRLTIAREALSNLHDLKGVAGSQETMGAFSAFQRAIPNWASALKSDDRIAFEKLDARVQRNIAKSMEQGAITGGEQAMYTGMLADSSNSHDAYMKTLDRIDKEVSAKQAAYERNLKASGYNVPPSGADVAARGRDLPATADLPPGEW